MAIVGFNFTKISAEKKGSKEANVTIQSNASVNSLNEIKSLDSKKSMLQFGFKFTCKYEPNVGLIELDGEVLELYDKDLATKIVDLWKKDNRVHPQVLQGLFNTILSKSNMQAIVMSRDLGLPSPIQMPRVDVKINEKGVETKSESKPESKPAKEDKPKKK